jgi:hypothetical protein
MPRHRRKMVRPLAMLLIGVIAVSVAGCAAVDPDPSPMATADDEEPPCHVEFPRGSGDGPYQIPLSLLEKHGIGTAGALSHGACPAIPIAVLAEAIPGIEPGDSIVGSERYLLSVADSGPPSIRIMLNPTQVAPHVLHTRDLSCDCGEEGFRCQLLRRESVFDTKATERIELGIGTPLDVGLQVARLYRDGSLILKYPIEHPDDLKSMRVTSVGRCGDRIRVEVSTADQHWGGVLQVRIEKKGGQPKLEVLYAAFGGV